MSEVIPIGRKPERVEGDMSVEATTDFNTLMQKNAEKKKREKEEREKANKGVIRSYRLKH